MTPIPVAAQEESEERLVDSERVSELDPQVPASVPAMPRVDAGPPAGTEIVALRDERSATFTTDKPGVLRTRISSAPMHIDAGDGAWKRIDLTLVDVGGDNIAPAVSNSGLIFAPEDTGSGVVSLRLDNATEVSFGLGGAASRDYEVEGSNLTFTGVWPETDVDLEAMWWG